jgi:hypothetical protein
MSPESQTDNILVTRNLSSPSPAGLSEPTGRYTFGSDAFHLIPVSSPAVYLPFTIAHAMRRCAWRIICESGNSAVETVVIALFESRFRLQTPAAQHKLNFNRLTMEQTRNLESSVLTCSAASCSILKECKILPVISVTCVTVDSDQKPHPTSLVRFNTVEFRYVLNDEAFKTLQHNQIGKDQANEFYIDKTHNFLFRNTCFL